jgi:hypothetical protein
MTFQSVNRLIGRIVHGRIVHGVCEGASEACLADAARAAMILAHVFENGRGAYWDAVLRGDVEVDGEITETVAEEVSSERIANIGKILKTVRQRE